MSSPFLKQGNRSVLNNYCPISVIPVVAKVFERIIYDQFYNHVTLLYTNSFQGTNRDFVPYIPPSLHYLKLLIAGLTTLTRVM